MKKLSFFIVVVLIIFSACVKTNETSIDKASTGKTVKVNADKNKEVSLNNTEESIATKKTTENENRIDRTIQKTAVSQPEAEPEISADASIWSNLQNRGETPEFESKPKTDDGIYLLAPYAIGNFMLENDPDLIRGTDDNGDYYGFSDHFEFCGLWCGLSISGSAEASSTLAKQGNISYDAINVAESSNSDRNLVWCEGVPGYGIGENITIKQTLTGSRNASAGDLSLLLPVKSELEERTSFLYNNMCIVNGYAKNEKLWAENSRVKSMKLYVDDVLYAYIELEDTIKPQYFPLYNILAFSTTEMSFKFEITDVYPGDKYDDTCITGIILGSVGIGGH